MSADMDWRTISPSVAPEKMTRFSKLERMLGRKERKMNRKIPSGALGSW